MTNEYLNNDIKIEFNQLIFTSLIFAVVFFVSQKSLLINNDEQNRFGERKMKLAQLHFAEDGNESKKPGAKI